MKLKPGSYYAVHSQVRRILGPAREYDCVDCDRPAMDWTRTDGTDGLDTNDYRPRCRKCHRAYDLSHGGGKVADRNVSGEFSKSVRFLGRA